MSAALTRSAELAARAAQLRGRPCEDAIADLWRDVRRELERARHRTAVVYVAPPERADWIGLSDEIEVGGEVWRCEVDSWFLGQLRVQCRVVDEAAWMEVV